MKKTINYGILYDAISLFTIYFNQDKWKKKMKLYSEDIEEDMVPFYEMKKSISEIPDELIVFFYIANDKPSLFSSLIFKEIINTDILNIEQVFSDMLVDNKLYDYVINFYFSNIKIKENNLNELYHILSKQDIDDKIKYNLFYYLQNHKEVNELLKKHFIDSYMGTEKYHADNEEEALKIENKTKMKIVKNFISKNTKFNHTKNEFKTYVCFNNSYILYIRENKDFIIIGKNIDAYIKNKALDSLVTLSAFGKAFSDQLRIDIFNIIYKRNSVSITELVEILSLPRTTIAYHLELLHKYNVFTTIKKGNTKYYKINASYLKRMKHLITELINGIKVESAD